VDELQREKGESGGNGIEQTSLRAKGHFGGHGRKTEWCEHFFGLYEQAFF